MKKLIITTLLFAALVSTLQSQSYKFVAMDAYYDTSILIDSILIHNMDTKEEQTVYSDSVYFEILSSVEDYSNESALKLYPNPVEDVLNIELTNGINSTLIMADVTGKVHFTYNAQLHQKLSLNVAGLPTGAYNISYGQHTEKFVKNSSANGSEVSVISTESTYNSQIKENEVQTQFEYRFTLYCTGFKPRSHFMNAPNKDKIITLDLSPLPSVFDGKHIRVELFLDSLQEIREVQKRDSDDTYDTSFVDFKYILEDTLVIRKGVGLASEHRIIRIDYTQSDPLKSFENKDFSFEIDTVNSIIKSFKLNYIYENHSEDSNDYDTFGFTIEDEINSNFLDDMKLTLPLMNIKYSYNRTKRAEYYYKNEGVVYSNYSYSSSNPTKSYIKIEIID